MKAIFNGAAAAVLAVLALAATAAGQQAPQGKITNSMAPPDPKVQARGEVVFKERCASCHEPAVDRAPNKAALASRWGDEIIASLKTGMMQPMAAGMSDADMNAVAIYLTGRNIVEPVNLAGEDRNRCAASNRFNPAGPAWNGWSPDAQNMRRAVSTSIGAAHAPKLKVKWAFAYQGGRYGQPTAFGNRVFLTSSSGRAYALDRDTGCVAWSFSAKTGMRVTASVGRNAQAPSGYAVYFGDFQRNVYAVDANSGKQLWMTNVEGHPRAVLTGAPVLYENKLYVPLSSWEETVGNLDLYECCTARGGIAALDTANGKIAWKTYVLPTPQPFRKSKAGVQMYGPAGAAIWSPPTIDPKRRLIYAATGDSYTDVKEDASDGVIAFNMDTGAIAWKHQLIEDDNFLVGCNPRAPAANCPETFGPDFDFGAAPILVRVNGKDMLFAGQKSGHVYALDPDDKGKKIWETRIGRGSALGGIEWGMAADNENLYVAVADRGMPTLTALRLADGAQLWQHRAPDPKCSWQGPCRNGYSGPPTLANGVLYGVNQDGHVRAFEAKTGKPLWDYDTAGRTYQTVNGVEKQRGGNLDATGITFAGSQAYLMAGFNGASSSSPPDNALLVFSVDGK